MTPVTSVELTKDISEIASHSFRHPELVSGSTVPLTSRWRRSRLSRS
jgi:hypothetical protein